MLSLSRRSLLVAVFLPLIANGFQIAPTLSRPVIRGTQRFSSIKETAERTGWAAEEAAQIREGATFLVDGRAWNRQKLEELATWEDAVGTLGIVPLVSTSLFTAWTGQVDAISYSVCAMVTLAMALAHDRMYTTTVRDWRAPRLGEARTTYQFSSLYLVAFGWLLARVNVDYFPTWLEVLDVPMAMFLTGVVLYGYLYPAFAKTFFPDGKDMTSSTIDATFPDVRQFSAPVLLEPSTSEFQKETQLLLTGQIVINSLAGLFIPFTWVLVMRGTDWWGRVIDLHEHQAAFLGVSILTAILGDALGSLLLRIRDKDIITSWPAVVFAGLVANFLLLLMPEVCFNVAYHAGVSEIGFYFE